MPVRRSELSGDSHVRTRIDKGIANAIAERDCLCQQQGSPNESPITFGQS